MNYEISHEASFFAAALDIKDKGSYIAAICINTPEKGADGLKNTMRAHQKICLRLQTWMTRWQKR